MTWIHDQGVKFGTPIAISVAENTLEHFLNKDTRLQINKNTATKLTEMLCEKTLYEHTLKTSQRNLYFYQSDKDFIQTCIFNKLNQMNQEQFSLFYESLKPNQPYHKNFLNFFKMAEQTEFLPYSFIVSAMFWLLYFVCIHIDNTCIGLKSHKEANTMISKAIDDTLTDMKKEKEKTARKLSDSILPSQARNHSSIWCKRAALTGLGIAASLAGLATTMLQSEENAEAFKNIFTF